MGLSEQDILNLGRHVGREILAHSEEELVLGDAQQEIVLGAVVTKDAMLNPEITAMQRVVPEDVDS